MTKTVLPPGKHTYRHPAHNMPIDDLISGLEDAVSRGLVDKSADGVLTQYSYNKRCMEERHWNPYTMIARGIVIDTEKKQIAALPYPKFFNYGEVVAQWPELPFIAQPKIDGVLIICFNHGGQWKTATRGSLKSDQAKWASQYLSESGAYSLLDEKLTYLFELIAPEFRVQINYGCRRSLILTGAYVTSTGQELEYPDLENEAARTRLEPVPIEHLENLPQLQSRLDSMGNDEEGFVVRFSDGLRLKLKSKAYLSKECMTYRITPLAVWEDIRDNIDSVQRNKNMPEEVTSEYSRIREQLLNSLRQEYEFGRNLSILISDSIVSWKNSTDFRRQFANEVKQLLRRDEQLQKLAVYSAQDKVPFDKFVAKAIKFVRPTRHQNCMITSA